MKTDALVRDLGYAVRVLRKSRLFTATAVTTLALCIGANTAIFTVVDQLLLRTPPYPQADRLAAVVRHFDSGEDDPGQTGRTWVALDGVTRRVDLAAIGGTTGVNLMAGDQPMFVQQQRVSARFFRVLGVAPALGRGFTDEDDRAGGPAVVVLSDGLWRRALDADPAAVGRRVMLRGEADTVAGVMPAGFHRDWIGGGIDGIRDRPVDLWTPLRPSPRGEGAGDNYEFIARLRPGVTWPQADAEVASLGADSLRRFAPNLRMRLHLVPMQRGLTEGLRRPLFVLWGAVGVVLLIGCVNIAGLLLARAAARAPELATRVAIGGGRGVIVRQLLVESLVLAAAGGLAGVAVGAATLRASGPLLRDAFGTAQTLTLDGRVLAIAAAATLLTGVSFGLLPAIGASRVDVRRMLADSGGPSIAGGARRWPRRALVVAEVALGMVLLVAAGLLLRTFAHLTALRPGFDGTNVTTATLSLQDARYRASPAVNRLFDRTIERLHAVPGVERAAVCLTLPYERALNVPGRFAGGGRILLINLTYVTPEYFDVLKIARVEGRVFDAADRAGSASVVVVNRAFARRYSPRTDPVGRHVVLLGGAAREIVGVVGDVQQVSNWGNGWEPVAALPAAYVPASQFGEAFALAHTWLSPSWIVRTAGPVAGIAEAMQHAVRAIDPALPFNTFRTLDEVRADALATERAEAALLGALAGLAVLLAAVGLYGLGASSIVERTREIGIRIAFGATPIRAIAAAAVPGVVLGAAGVAIGLIAARAGTRVMRALVWGVPVTDPATFAAAAGGVLAITVVAALVPSLGILTVDAASLLRARR